MKIILIPQMLDSNCSKYICYFKPQFSDFCWAKTNHSHCIWYVKYSNCLCQLSENIKINWTNIFLSFFLSYSDLFQPTHCRYRGLLLHLIALGDAYKLDRTPLGKCSALCRVLYLTKHNTHKRKTSMPPAEFKPTIPASKWL